MLVRLYLWVLCLPFASSPLRRDICIAILLGSVLNINFNSSSSNSRTRNNESRQHFLGNLPKHGTEHGTQSMGLPFGGRGFTFSLAAFPGRQ
uniref:Putative secreted peptide n=1 Tax=Anopheles braziliensis TaxID=58242 RepID=A0A2M3ZUF1_9DIPT